MINDAVHYGIVGEEEAIILLEAALVFGQKALEIMEQHPVEHRAFGMPRRVNTCHNRSGSSRNGPALPKHALCPWAPGRCRPGPSLLASESQQELTKARMRRQQTLSRSVKKGGAAMVNRSSARRCTAA